MRRAGAAPAPAPDGSAEIARSTRGLLAVCCVAQFMVILDLTIVNVALPSIQSALGFSAINLQWVVDAYSIVFAGFLMLAGRATDRLGHRSSLAGALVAFSLASVLGGTAPDQAVLIVARAVQGLAGALMAAASLATITAAFAAGPARNRAIGLWGAMNGSGGAAGALLGGVITQELGWRWVLLINPPIGLAAAAVALVVIGRRGEATAGARFDLAGALALTIGLIALVYGIVNAGVLGWSAPLAIGPFFAGLALLGLFPLVEARLARDPLVPPGALDAPLRIANGIVITFSAALFAMWYVSSLYLQQVLGLSPLLTGLTFLPMALTIMLVASRAGRLVGVLGLRTVLAGGLSLMTAGMVLFARIAPSGSAWGYVLVPGMLVALGIGCSVVPSTIAATASAGPERAGLASGLVNTSRQVGGAIGIALFISLATSDSSGLIGGDHSVPAALTDGFRVAYLVGALFCLVALGLTLAFVGRHGAPSASRWRGSRIGVLLVALVAVFVAVDFAATAAPAPPIGRYTLDGAATYVSAPDLHPPVLRTVIRRAGVTDEDLGLTSFYDVTAGEMVGQSGPLLVDDELQPIWFAPVSTDVVAANLSEQHLDGEPVLCWWQGVITATGATLSGEDRCVNEHYQTVAVLHGADGWVLTLHDLVISGDDAWVTANRNLSMNLTAYGGAHNGALTDSAVQEYDLSTGRLVRNWDARTHIALSDSHTPPPTNGFPWDAYHVNSISLGSNGTFLVSMRDTWAAYDVDEATGKILWSIGGTHSTISLGPGASFEWQHDVQLSGSRLTIFDDECCEITGAGTYLAPNGPSRAIVLHLDLSTRRATLVRAYTLGPDLASAYMGSTAVLPNGSTLVGWGEQPYLSEYNAAGELVLEGEFPAPDLSYRANPISDWVGEPHTRPAGAARRDGSSTRVYASWNGATAVVSWRIVAFDATGASHTVATIKKTGFETVATVAGHAARYEVVALGSGGRELQRSAAFAPTR